MMIHLVTDRKTENNPNYSYIFYIGISNGYQGIYHNRATDKNSQDYWWEDRLGFVNDKANR